jgi:uncharacterized protein
MGADESASHILAIERPSPKLLHYYILQSLLAGPFFPFVFLPRYFKYHTLRYRFDHEGISMRWGIIFRREVILNYSRIQDIHLSSNIVERWLNLAKVQIQTASGSANAEMTIEGLLEFAAVRDFLYAKMRGIKDPVRPPTIPRTASVAETHSVDGELARTLQAVAEELRAIRVALESKQGPR